MSLLYITADTIGASSGGGLVTHHESDALRSMGPCEVWDRSVLQNKNDPWGWDDYASEEYVRRWYDGFRPKLAHFYSGTWGSTVKCLQHRDCKVSITIAAHDRFVSRREHESLGFGFPYPHLVERELWQRYIEGYRLADVIICPSSIAAETVRAYGPEFEEKDIRIIPHGTDLPETVAPLPKHFVCGYLGSFGADKGVRYLLEAWKKLNYTDATLILAGRDSTSSWARHLIDCFGGGNIQLRGWVDNPSDFYNSLSLYVQPSATEGFGIEVTEAMAHDRPVICSLGAGAADVVPMLGGLVSACSSDSIAQQIDAVRNEETWVKEAGAGTQSSLWRRAAENCTWDKVRALYVQTWSELNQH